MKPGQRSRRLAGVDFPETENTMSDHTTTQLQQFGLGTAVLASLVFAPGTAAAATNNPIVIDFDQGRLILGWASLWIVTVFAHRTSASLFVSRPPSLSLRMPPWKSVSIARTARVASPAINASVTSAGAPAAALESRASNSLAPPAASADN